MSAGEISKQVLYNLREKLFASKTGRSVCSGPVWSFTSGERRRYIYTCVLRRVLQAHKTVRAKGSHDPLVPEQIS